MSNEDYDLRQAGMDLFNKLSVSLAQKANGDTGRPLSEVMKDIRKKIREKSTPNHSRPEIL